MDDNVFEFSLTNELAEIVEAAAKIEAFCEANDVSPDVAYAVNLSVDEILTNTITYGYADEETHRIEIAVRLEAEALVVVIVDDSSAFDLTAAPEPDLGASLEEREVGGLGLFLVHQMMDEVEYERAGDRNVATLTKRTGGDV